MIFFLIFAFLILIFFLKDFFSKTKTEDGYGMVVSRSSFKYRLIRWTLNKDPKFVGYCPFFWAFWLCVFLIPVTLFVKLFEFVFVCSEEEEEEKGIAQPAISELIRYYNDEWLYHHYSYKYKEWFDANPNWRQIVEDELAKEAIKEEARERRKQKTDKILAIFDKYLSKCQNYLSYLVKPFLITSALFVTYLFYVIVKNIFSSVSISTFVYSGVITISLVLVVFLAKKAYKWLKVAARVIEKSKIPLEPKKESYILTKLAGLIMFIPRLISRTYTKECPIITFKD